MLTGCILVVVLLMCAGGTLARYSKSAEGRVRDYLLDHANFSSRDRPVLDSKDSVDVGIRIQLYAMLDVRERDQVITTASWITLTWTDEQLLWDPLDFDGVDLVVIHTDEIWIPRIFVSNALDANNVGVVSAGQGSILLTSEGDVNLGIPLIQTTQCPIQIKYFPFDTQMCEFQFIPENHPSEKMRIFTQPARVSRTFDTSEWKFSNVTHNDVIWEIEGLVPNRALSPYTVATVCIFLNRDPTYYISTLIIPSTLLCLMSFATFLAPPDSGERISLGVSMVLGLTVFQILVADLLPATDEDPILGDYLSINFILACLVVPFSLGNITITYGDKSLWFLKRPTLRRFMLEVMPRVVGIPTYRMRVLVMTGGRSDGSGSSAEVNTGDCGPGPGQNEDQEIGTAVGPDTFVIRDTVKTSRVEQRPLKLTPRTTTPEQIKLEARTVALVLDRIFLSVFLVIFAYFCVTTSLKFRSNPGIETRYETCGVRDISRAETEAGE